MTATNTPEPSQSQGIGVRSGRPVDDLLYGSFAIENTISAGNAPCESSGCNLYQQHSDIIKSGSWTTPVENFAGQAGQYISFI